VKHLKKIAYKIEVKKVVDSYADPTTLAKITANAHSSKASPSKVSEGKTDVDDDQPDDSNSNDEATTTTTTTTTTTSEQVPPPKATSPTSTDKGSVTKQKSTADTTKAKVIFVCRNGDAKWEGKKLVVSKQKFRNWSQLLTELSAKVQLPTGPVRKLYILPGFQAVAENIDDLQDGGQYVCCGAEGLEKLSYKIVTE